MDASTLQGHRSAWEREFLFLASLSLLTSVADGYVRKKSLGGKSFRAF